LVISIITITGLWYFFIYEPAHRVVVVEIDCDCNDLADIENRINEANAAIKEYGAMLEELQQQDAKSGKATMYSQALQKSSDERLEAALGKVSSKDAKTLVGETAKNCSITVNATTKCMIKSMRAHEKSNAESCERVKDKLMAEKGMYAADSTYYRDTLTLAEYWKDEIAAYNAELVYLNKNLQLARADNSCK
jgi:uncharacterized protein YbaA (DUF1428 family)